MTGLSKDRGSIAIYALFIVLGLLLASSFFMVYSKINLESMYMFFYNLQAKKASEYGIQKYLEALKEEYVNGNTLPKSGLMGETSKFEVRWKTEENLTEEPLGGGINSQSIYERYPFTAESWEKLSQLALTGSKYSLSGDYNSKLDSDDFLVSFINSDQNAIKTCNIYFRDISESFEYSIDKKDYTFMDSYYYWNPVLNAMEVYYCLLYKNEAGTDTVVDVYRGSPEIGGSLIKVYSFELPGDTEKFELAGVNSKVVNSTFLYFIYKQQGENITIKKFFTASGQMEDVDTIDKNDIRDLSASCVWNPVINMEELYIGIVGTDNSFEAYLLNGGEKEELPGSNSVELSETAKNFAFNAVFCSNLGKSVVYMLVQKTAGGSYQTYRYINDISATWEGLGEFNFESGTKPEICGVYSPRFRYLVFSSKEESSRRRVTGICTSIGEVYKKDFGQKPLLARVRINFKVELDYEKDPSTGQGTVLKVNITDINGE